MPEQNLFHWRWYTSSFCNIFASLKNLESSGYPVVKSHHPSFSHFNKYWRVIDRKADRQTTYNRTRAWSGEKEVPVWPFPFLSPLPFCLSFSPPTPSFPFPFHPFSRPPTSLLLEIGPLNPARGLGERCKLPQTHFWHILRLLETHLEWTQQF